MLRRTLLLAALAAPAASLVPARASARPPGTSAGPELLSAVSAMRGVMEGTGGNVHILYAPWCSVTPRLHADTRGFLGRMRLNWIPFAGGQPEGRTATELLLRSGRPEDVPRYFTSIRALAPLAEAPLADAQERSLSSLLTYYYRDVGGSLATPTVVFGMRDGTVRVMKGAPGPAHLADVAAYAA